MSTDDEPLFQSATNEDNQINVIRNINTYARTKTLAQGFLDMALFTANASQMKHLLQQGPGTQFYYFLFVSLCISVSLQLIVAALLIYKGSKNIEYDDPERRLSDRKKKAFMSGDEIKQVQSELHYRDKHQHKLQQNKHEDIVEWVEDYHWLQPSLNTAGLCELAEEVLESQLPSTPCMTFLHNDITRVVSNSFPLSGLWVY
ncbi:uncharacterized protein LOC127529209 [Erpetoichthys calabaricus]|uniref:uncharacterized protein LOC127529209 n=1 Tax=Erpetoichthys calabaricus TaxID=27687 RepID=UPI0022346FD4|nr:uncharacterized protein LOC127529209 [Erpetoichthys calabaricus]